MIYTRRSVAVRCGKSESQVVRLIAGPGVFICNECVALCDEILNEDFRPVELRESMPDMADLMNPVRIKESLRPVCHRPERAKKR